MRAGPFEPTALDPAPAPADGLPFEQAVTGLLSNGRAWREHLAAPGLALAWSQVLVQHWSRLQALGALDISEPMYLLDLGPGHAELANLLLPALDAELHAHGMQAWPLQVLA